MKTVHKRVIIPSIASTALLVVAVLGFSGALKDSTSSTKYADWMASIDDNTTLREINMPGTHDTMALYSMGNLMGQCQTLSLKEQLNLGVRFLDIRLVENNGALKAMHGIVDQRSNFASITKTIEKFLNTHQKECILLSIKNEADSRSYNPHFEEALIKHLDNEIFYKEKELPQKIGDVRGKAILLSRYEQNTIGVNCFNGWRDSCSFLMEQNDIYVQDTYKVTSKEQKQQEIINCFNETGHALKINFLSAYRTNAFPPSYSISSAKDINPWINQEIANYHDRGVVLYDFVNESNMDSFFKGLL